ncbi:hypothetical protein GCM10008967_00170 [Bacillus carboniphilus]|uniref:Uncharacterized protein n=1 Tax=Bacillus carboniphilus TaxID=86663 RepID=A0ABP3FB09_9BACI
MINIIKNFVRNEIVAPILGLAAGALVLYIIAKYAETIFNFLL